MIIFQSVFETLERANGTIIVPVIPQYFSASLTGTLTKYGNGLYTAEHGIAKGMCCVDIAEADEQAARKLWASCGNLKILDRIKDRTVVL